MMKPKFLYAERAKAALTYGITLENGNHIQKRAYDDIQSSVHKRYMTALERKEYLPEFDDWQYSKSYATVAFADEMSATAGCEWIRSLGYTVKTI